MRHIGRVLIAISVLAIMLVISVSTSQAAGCDSGRVHAANGDLLPTTCFTIYADVRGYECAPLAFIDGGGVGASTARAAAERMGRIDCAEQASHALYGDLMTGTRLSDGGDSGMRIRPAEVTVLGVERR